MLQFKIAVESSLQKWYLMDVLPGVDIDGLINLEAGRYPGHWREYAWFDLHSLSPLAAPHRRGVYAHLAREFSATISDGSPAHHRTATSSVHGRLTGLPADDAIDAIIRQFGAAKVQERLAASSQQSQGSEGVKARLNAARAPRDVASASAAVAGTAAAPVFRSRTSASQNGGAEPAPPARNAQHPAQGQDAARAPSEQCSCAAHADELAGSRQHTHEDVAALAAVAPDAAQSSEPPDPSAERYPAIRFTQEARDTLSVRDGVPAAAQVLRRNAAWGSGDLHMRTSWEMPDDIKAAMSPPAPAHVTTERLSPRGTASRSPSPDAVIGRMLANPVVAAAASTGACAPAGPQAQARIEDGEEPVDRRFSMMAAGEGAAAPSAPGSIGNSASGQEEFAAHGAASAAGHAHASHADELCGQLSFAFGQASPGSVPLEEAAPHRAEAVQTSTSSADAVTGVSTRSARPKGGKRAARRQAAEAGPAVDTATLRTSHAQLQSLWESMSTKDQSAGVPAMAFASPANAPQDARSNEQTGGDAGLKGAGEDAHTFADATADSRAASSDAWGTPNESLSSSLRSGTGLSARSGSSRAMAQSSGMLGLCGRGDASSRQGPTLDPVLNTR